MDGFDTWHYVAVHIVAYISSILLVRVRTISNKALKISLNVVVSLFLLVLGMQLPGLVRDYSWIALVTPAVVFLIGLGTGIYVFPQQEDSSEEQ